MYNKENNSFSQYDDTVNQNSADITLKVIGVGGAGNNAIQMMERDVFKNVEFVVANTDAQALFKNDTKIKIPLGKDSRGLGAGSDPEVGEKRAKESSREIEEVLKGADVVIIAAGFGGGTGTGAAPVIAELARNAGALTIAIVTTPFMDEGKKRSRVAREGLEKLKQKVDSYIVVSNEKLMEHYPDVPVDDAFRMSNLYLKNIIISIHDILYRIGKVNIDYADVRKVLDNAGLTLVGLGQASGKDRAIKAVEKAFQNHLYSVEIAGAEKFLINIQYDKTATLSEVRAAIKRVNEILNKDPEVEDDIIIGHESIEGSEDIFKVSIIAGHAIQKEESAASKPVADPAAYVQPVVQQTVQYEAELNKMMNETQYDSVSSNDSGPYVDDMYEENEYEETESKSSDWF
ncbi:cell division protein FtsZ [Mycoplasma sp. Ms02]|uniref:cell division protein FtsZ n=1 Tax=Mycoplasma sp. Ms02 TaxID=353851 RepID=UPI001C89EE5B|nr:cell division protein FtsZ [Mycoplasma sp. Ms02]QZE12510.1 cell division protein FtsZ [Mycoplasma sp. Ms02]